MTIEYAVGSFKFRGCALALMLGLTVGKAIGIGVPFALLPLGAFARQTQIINFHHTKFSPLSATGP